MVKHFDRWGLEVHVGTKINKESESDVLFCVADSRCYYNRSSFDDTDLSPIRWKGGFTYLLWLSPNISTINYVEHAHTLLM
jgi:hypothetical protein